MYTKQAENSDSARDFTANVNEDHEQDIDEKLWICWTTMENLQFGGFSYTSTTYQLCNLGQTFSEPKSLNFSSVKWIHIVVKLKWVNICENI